MAASVLRSWGTPLVLSLIVLQAFCIRIFSVVKYESVIHEFDPYFNYRTTERLVEEGLDSFWNWFDDRTWHPIGRVVGGTLYPALMLTGGGFHAAAAAAGLPLSVRNACVYLAPAFAGLTALSTFGFAKEVSHREGAALLAAAFVGVVPSYISRSCGGSYDNEGVAIFALVTVFRFYARSLNSGSVAAAVKLSLCYLYMVAAWGGCKGCILRLMLPVG